MRFVLVVPVLLLAAGLGGCVSNKQQKTVPAPASWGNFKCDANSYSGESYTGWSVDKEHAQINALTICKQRSGRECTLAKCVDAVIEKNLD